MEGSILLLLMLGTCSQITGILASENERTALLSSENDKLILSSSSYNLQEEKTADGSIRDSLKTSILQRTLPSPQLSGSENYNIQHNENLETENGKTNEFTIRNSLPEHESIDFLTSNSKHVDQIDGNNIETKSGDYTISPTKSEENLSGEERGAPRGLNLVSEPQRQIYGMKNNKYQHQHQLYQQDIKNMRQMYQQRQSRQDIPRIYSEHAPPPVLQTALPAGHGKRQANPDIQDIITGIVKLLNGNVNVAANTGRPLRPIQATRINNRGPPRISDVPPLPPDFDTPGMNPPPLPDHPYPFEKPPPPVDRPSVNQLPPERPVRPFINDVPEHVVGNQGNRPGYENLWNRPGLRPAGTGTRRPIPPYKPLPPPEKDQGFEKHTEKLEKPRPSPSLDNDQIKTGENQLINKLGVNVSSLNNNNNNNNTIMNSKPIGIGNSNEDKKDSVNDLNNKSSQQGDSKPMNTKPADSRPNYNNGSLKKPQKYQPPIKNDDQITSQNTLILGSNPLSYPIPNSDDNVNENENDSVKNLQNKSSVVAVSSLRDSIKPSKTIKDEKTGFSKNGNGTENVKEDIAIPPAQKSTFEKTLAVETSTSIKSMEPTPTIIEIQPTVIPLKNNDDDKLPSIDFPKLEPSKIENSEIKIDVSTPTENLPSLTQSSTNSLDKSNTLTATSSSSKTPAPTNYYPYRPRPGIVLDDTLDYTKTQGLATHRPYSPPRYPQIGDIFDVTVSAIQGPGGGGSSGESVRVSLNPASGDVIVTSAAEGQGFVSIDGKRTYLNLFDNSESGAVPSSETLEQPLTAPTRTQSPPIVGTGYAVAQPDVPPETTRPATTPVRRPPIYRRPSQPPVRIDTCIVGDSSTCDGSQHEACATVQGVSACHCKPGYSRSQHSLPCKKTVSIVVSIRVDKIYERKVIWDKGFVDKDSEAYQTLSYEANRAVESAMSMTPFSDEYIGSSVNSIYQGDISQGQGGVFVNTTLKLTYEPRTSRPLLASELQKHLLGVIHRRNNNIGNSALWVESPPGSISNLQDLDECESSELNDCHSSANCKNNWGGFTCVCQNGFKDPHKNDPNESGRVCLSCPTTHCNNRGLCSYQGEEMHCSCTGNYYGAQCEIDGEVLGVAIGASVAALIIIVLTLVCLVMWNRRWSREQKTVGSSPVYGYMQGGMPGTLPGTLARVGSVGTLASVKQGPPSGLPPYMWAHIADHMATANVYAAEPMGSTRPSSAMFGYPNLSMHGTLPPVPLPRLQAPPRPRHRHQPEPDSSDSEPQDRDRADLIPQNGGFHVPRPRSRASMTNQSGIYYDVEYDQGDSQHLSKNNIPMSTYSMARPYYRT